MEKEFISYDQALALKELGFDEPCFGLWNINNGKYEVDIIGVCKYSEKFKYREVLAPTFSQAFRWFRDEYKLWFRPDYYDEIRDYFTGSIHKLGKFSALYNLEHYATAEECESACIDKLIEMAKNEKHTHTTN